MSNVNESKIMYLSTLVFHLGFCKSVWLIYQTAFEQIQVDALKILKFIFGTEKISVLGVQVDLQFMLLKW